MSRPSKAEKWSSLHQTVLKRFNDIQSAVYGERRQCLADRRFCSIAGAQWEGSLGDQFENRPKFEVNKVHLSVIRIINEYRNNRITVDFISKDGAQDDKLATTLDGLYRADEQDSTAEEAYDNAFEEAVMGGLGAWRLRAKYEDDEDEEDERQRICIEPIFDADSTVFFDVSARRQDKADARFCFVLTPMSPEAYTDAYGDDPTTWPKEIDSSEFDWYTPDQVWVAEYYEVEEKSETLVVFRGLDGSEKKIMEAELDDDELDALDATGFTEHRRKKIKSRRIHKWIMSGGGILEDAGYIAGKCIPIVPVYGKRWIVDGTERCMGHVRLSKDAQRLKNMQLSKLGEISALNSIEKPVFTPEQIQGHEMTWAEDNIKNNPYLLINPVTDASGQKVLQGAVDYTRSPQIPPAMAALLQITEQDMQDLLGNQQQGEELTANISGKAVELVQNRLDMQAFIYMSNMARAMKLSGEIWLSMAKELLVEEGRVMKTVSPQGDVGSVTLMKPVKGEKTGVAELENDITSAKFDVAVSVGPSSQSKRAATVRAITGMMTLTQDPETLQVLTNLAMMNLEGEGIDEVRGYFRRKMVRAGVVEPTPEEAEQIAQEQANAQPDAQQAYLQAAAEQAVAEAVKARADTIAKIAQAEKTKAETAKIITDIDATEQQQAFEIIDRIANVQPEQPETATVIVEPQPPSGGM